MSENGKDREKSAPRRRCSIHGIELNSSGECEICSQLISGSGQPVVWVFDDGDDKGYRSWIARHRGGYVINVQKSFNPTDARLHHATCSDINGDPTNGQVFVGDYVKVCALWRSDLDNWAESRLGATVQECQRCY